MAIVTRATPRRRPYESEHVGMTIEHGDNDKSISTPVAVRVIANVLETINVI